MSIKYCFSCGHLNAESLVICGACGRALDGPTQPNYSATTTRDVNRLQRNSIVACCALSLLLFFFPLLTIHVPIAGDQDVTGYDVFSKLTEFQEKLKPPNTTSPSAPSVTNARTPPPDIPLSIQLAWLTPLAIIIAFVSAAVALIGAFKDIHFSRLVCVFGAACAGAAILHITIMNSDIHSWLNESMKTAQSDLKDNPYAGLAENIGTLIVNAFQIKPGWAVYALLVLLGLAAVLGFSRLLSRLRLAPADS